MNGYSIINLVEFISVSYKHFSLLNIGNNRSYQSGIGNDIDFLTLKSNQNPSYKQLYEYLIYTLHRMSVHIFICYKKHYLFIYCNNRYIWKMYFSIHNLKLTSNNFYNIGIYVILCEYALLIKILLVDKIQSQHVDFH